MARWYSSFDNSTIAGVEAATNGNRRQRLTMTNGAVLKAALLAARTALSNAVYAQIDAANENGAAGVTIPVDGYSRGGGNLTWSELYTNAAAVFNADPRIRPTGSILVAGSTLVTPSDPGSITESLYTDAQTALQNVLAGIATIAGGSGNGPYSRIGQNPWRTLASIFHDDAMTYFGWDDFSPGQPTTFTTTPPASQPAASALNITFNWANEFPADLEGATRLNLLLSRNGGGSSVNLTNQIVAAGTLSYLWTIPGGTLTAGTYTLDSGGSFRDATITTHFGTSRDYFNASFVTLT